MEVVVLGSGGPGATGRAGSSYLLLLDGAPRILVDAGPGAFVRLGEAKLSMSGVSTVLLTHLHADHAGGLPGLVKARAVSSRGKIQFNVFGPVGAKKRGDDAAFPSTSQFIDRLFKEDGAFGYLSNFSAPITFVTKNIGPAAAVNASPQKILVDGPLTISAISGHHRDAPAVLYRVDYRGRCVTFTGDIDPAGQVNLIRLSQGCDLLVFNSVVLDPPGSPPILYTLHTAPKDIGDIAAKAGIGRLLLSHLSPATDGARDEIRGSIASRFAGEVRFAEDGMRVVP
jgi:ribonuclease BN (tRNA processing enzyme)